MHHYDLYGWYTTEQLPGRSTDIAPSNTSTSNTPGELRANFTGYEWVDLPYQAPPEPAPEVVAVPESVTMRQARLALLGAGKLASVTAAINTLPSPQKEAAQIEWEYSQTVERNRGFVLLLSAALGLTDAQLDALFVTAARL
jgi:hypothetical protein